MGWQDAATKLHEHARLLALRRYAILDTPPERSFDTLTRLASEIFCCPFAIITLLDESRQWFKSRHGLDVTTTPREIAFCNHTIEQGGVFLVEDAAADPRFSHNPLVVDKPFVRFYAGYPLTTSDGYAIGSFAILDVSPRRPFSEADARKLQDMAALAIDAIELRRHVIMGDLLRSVVVHTSDGVMVTKPQREGAKGAEIMYANEALGRIVGLAPEAVIGEHTAVLEEPATDEEAVGEIFSKLESGESFRTEVRIRRSDGADCVAEIAGALVRDESGNSLHWVSIWRDVTERRNLQQSLAAAKERAERASEAKSWFLANMSHELRTPINAVIGYSEMMLDPRFGRPGSPKRQAYLEYILRAGRTLASLIDDLFDLASIETGRVSIGVESVDWSETVAAALELLAPELEKAKVRVDRRDPEGECYVRGDKRALKQVLINIVGNAAKFSPQGSVVELESRVLAGGDLRVVVRDQGIGMCAEDIPRALQPFEQLNAGYAKGFAGLGIGLPIVKQLVELHEGKLTIESKMGEGTTVIIDLPQHRVSSATPLASEPDG